MANPISPAGPGGMRTWISSTIRAGIDMSAENPAEIGVAAGIMIANARSSRAISSPRSLWPAS